MCISSSFPQPLSSLRPLERPLTETVSLAVLSSTLPYSRSNMGPTGPSPHVPIPRQKMHKHACDSTVEQPAFSSEAVSHLYLLGLETRALPAATLTCLNVGYCLRSPRGTMYYEFRLPLTFLNSKILNFEIQQVKGLGTCCTDTLGFPPNTHWDEVRVCAWKRISLVLSLSLLPLSPSPSPTYRISPSPSSPDPHDWICMGQHTALLAAGSHSVTPRETTLLWKLTRRMIERSQVSEDIVGLPILPRLDPSSL